MNNSTISAEKPRRQILLGMGIGESYPFPLEKMTAVRSDCQRYGIEWGKTFATAINRENRTITVTRKA